MHTTGLFCLHIKGNLSVEGMCHHRTLYTLQDVFIVYALWPMWFRLVFWAYQDTSMCFQKLLLHFHYVRNECSVKAIHNEIWPGQNLVVGMGSKCRQTVRDEVLGNGYMPGALIATSWGMMRMKDNRWTIRLTEWLPRDCRQNRGRPKIRWRVELRKFWGKEWTLHTGNRNSWKSLGEAFVLQWTQLGGWWWWWWLNGLSSGWHSTLQSVARAAGWL